jgi:HAD superfamily phosphoserine phosphatase-like hydrolase
MNIIFDFDSTIVKNETFNDVLKIALNDDKNKIKQIDEVVNKAMNGFITPKESMEFRFKIATINKKIIQQAINETTITDKMPELIKELKEKGHNVIIVSGGFTEMISPIANKIGIDKIYANNFIYNGDNVISIDDGILLQEQGKVKMINSLNLQGKKIMIGDGYTDLETWKYGAVDYFIAFFGVIKRDKVNNEANIKANNVDELRNIIIN